MWIAREFLTHNSWSDQEVLDFMINFLRKTYVYTISANNLIFKGAYAASMIYLVAESL
jgi:hypothetical protein